MKYFCNPNKSECRYNSLKAEPENLPNQKMQRQLLSPDKSIRSQNPNKSIRTQNYKHYDNKHIKSHIYGRDHTQTHTHTQAHQVFNINPSITKTYEQTAGRQQK